MEPPSTCLAPFCRTPSEAIPSSALEFIARAVIDVFQTSFERLLSRLRLETMAADVLMRDLVSRGI